MSFLCKNNVFLRKLNKSLVEIKVRKRFRRTFAEIEKNDISYIQFWNNRWLYSYTYC